MWYGLEYNLKNTYLKHGGDYKEEDREKYGFNQVDGVYQEDKNKEEQINSSIYADTVKPDSLEDYQKMLRTLGAMKTRMVTINGKNLADIEKALDGEEDAFLKAQYLHMYSEYNIKMLAYQDFKTSMQFEISDGLNELIKSKLDLNTATYDDLIKTMKLDGIRFKQPTDMKIIDYVRKEYPTLEGEKLENKVLESIRDTFERWNMGVGENIEYDAMSEEQKAIFEKGKIANVKTEEINFEKIKPWIKSTGKQEEKKKDSLEKKHEEQRITL